MAWQNARSPIQAAAAKRSADTRRSKIRQYLQDKQLTQKGFCQLAGIALTTFSRFMSGEMQTGSLAYTLSNRYIKRHP